MGKMKKYGVLVLPPQFFYAILQKKCVLTILTSLFDDIISPSYLLPRTGTRRRNFMMEQKVRSDEKPDSVTTVERHRQAREALEQLIIYAIQAFASLILFGLFFATSVAADWLCSAWSQTSIIIMCKIVSWIISALGGLCCIALVIRNTIAFIKFLIKGPPQETSGQKTTGEGRAK